MQKMVRFEKAIKTKYPEQVIIVIAKDKNSKPNPVTRSEAKVLGCC